MKCLYCGQDEFKVALASTEPRKIMLTCVKCQFAIVGTSEQFQRLVEKEMVLSRRPTVSRGVPSGEES